MHRFLPWTLVGLCFVLGVASRSVSDTFVVFVPALQAHFEASRSAVTVIYSFALLSSIGAPLAGWIADRFGLRVLTIIGLAAAALGTASASLAAELWQLYAGLGLLLGFGGVALGAVPSSIIIGRWFPANRLGVPMAVAWSATGVGVMVTLPLAQHLLTTEGWREAYRVLALFSAVLLPLVLFLPWRRIEAGAPGLHRARTTTSHGPTVGQAVRDWPFWALTFSFGLTSLGIFAVFPQAMAYLLERGIRLTGTDAWSWDAPFYFTAQKWAKDHDPSIIWEGHRAGREIGYCHIEKLHNLEALPANGFEISCFPVKVHAASAGWTRAVAIFSE